MYYINPIKLLDNMHYATASDYAIVLIIAKYCNNKNTDRFIVDEKFRQFCIDNHTHLAISTIMNKLRYLTEVKVLYRINLKEFKLNDTIYIKQ